MKPLCLILVALVPAGAFAQSPAPASRDAIVCQLLETCPETDTPRGPPRVGATRGFSFDRPGSKPVTGARAGKSATRKRTPGRPAPAMAAAAAAAAAATAVPGKYDLKVTFVSGSDVVSPDSRARVREFAAALGDPRLVGRRVLIEGHTDSIGDPNRNLDLSRRRAQAVAELVQGNGVEPGRLDIEGYGATRPLPGFAGTAGVNRRVVASLVK